MPILSCALREEPNGSPRYTLMVCMSHKETLRVVDSLVKDFDSDVRSWCSRLLSRRLPEYFAGTSSTTVWHIPSSRTLEMASPSVIVSCVVDLPINCLISKLAGTSGRPTTEIKQIARDVRDYGKSSPICSSGFVRQNRRS